MTGKQKKDLLGLALIESVGLVVLSGGVYGVYGLLLSTSSCDPAHCGESVGSAMFMAILGASLMVAGVVLWADEESR